MLCGIGGKDIVWYGLALFISGHARQIGGTSTAGAMLDSGYLTCLVPFSIGPRRRHRHHHQHHHHN